MECRPTRTQIVAVFLSLATCHLFYGQSPAVAAGGIEPSAFAPVAKGEYGGYLAPKDVIHRMIDAVSKNGTFILDIPGKPDGTIDSKEIAVLDGITAWMGTNGEAIYETRPWKVYGEGPNAVTSGAFKVRA